MAREDAEPRRAARPRAERSAGEAARGVVSPAASISPVRWMLGLAVFLGLALWVYQPALRGPFVSDDLHYVASNPYVHTLDANNLRAILDPRGGATLFVNNYTPVHLLLHALEWQVFGENVLGYHVVNVVLHSVASLLLVAVFLGSGVPIAAAWLGGALFLLHPANVEAVAWISQLKSTSSLVLSLGALVLFFRRPALASVLFVLSLLAKPTAVYAVPVLGLFVWARARDAAERRRLLGWVALWAAAFVVHAALEIVAHERGGSPDAPIHPDLAVRVRSSVAIALRYLVMSATSWGVSAFHEPDASVSLQDPWWLAGLVAFGVLGARAAVVLARRREEAAYWAWALAGFAPVSQIFPFLYPMADRYLYVILPGLLGAALLGLRDLRDALAFRASQRPSPALSRQLAAGPGVGLAAGIALLAVFGARSVERAAIWRSPAALLNDAASHYPDGVSAHLLHARRAAQIGDVDATVAALRVAQSRGFHRFEQLVTDPALVPVRSDPRFQAVVSEMAAWHLARSEKLVRPTQTELRMMGIAHYVRGEYAEAEQVLERALAHGGPIDELVRTELAETRAALRRSQRGAR